MLENPTTIEFEDPEHDFGEISLGSSVEFSFKFKNTGESPLIIQSVKAACGCTVLKDWPKEAILPGESAEIPVVFTAKYPGESEKIRFDNSEYETFNYKSLLNRKGNRPRIN